MDCHLGEQALEPILLADQAHRLRLLEDRRKQPVGDELRHHVGDADAKRDEALLAALAQDLLQFGAGLEDLLGVGQGQLSCGGEFHPASVAVEERHADPFLEPCNLPGERLRRQMQALGCPNDAALAGNADEVVQVLVVQHGDVPLSVIFEYIANYYLFVSNKGNPHNPFVACCPRRNSNAAPDPLR